MRSQAASIAANRCRFDGDRCRSLPLPIVDRRILDSGT